MPTLNKPYQHRGCLASGSQIRSDADDDWGAQQNKRKLRTTVSKWLGLKSEAHDRQAQELPAHARIASIEIDDPKPTSGETERIVVARSISADPLAWMHAHKCIDDAKYLAGRRWQGLHDRAAIGAMQSVDTTKEPVSGGRCRDALFSDHQAQAGRDLHRIQATLGPGRSALVLDVLGRGMFMPQAAAIRGVTSDWGRRKLTREFYLSLDQMAVAFGLATNTYKSGTQVA
jgi:hypothetical protein